MTELYLNKYAIGPRYCPKCGNRLQLDLLNPEVGERYCWKDDRVFEVKFGGLNL